MAAGILRIRPIDGPLDATVTLPGSKSLTNRAMVAAALARGETELAGALLADDTRRMVESVGRLGLAAEVDRTTGTIRVEG